MTWFHITGDQLHMFVSSIFAIRVSPLILGYAADIICASVISLSLVFSRNRLNKLDVMHKGAKRHVSPSYAASSYSCLAGQVCSLFAYHMTSQGTYVYCHTNTFW